MLLGYIDIRKSGNFGLGYVDAIFRTQIGSEDAAGRCGRKNTLERTCQMEGWNSFKPHFGKRKTSDALRLSYAAH